MMRKKKEIHLFHGKFYCIEAGVAGDDVSVSEREVEFCLSFLLNRQLH